MRTLALVFLLAQPCVAQFEGAISLRHAAVTPAGAEAGVVHVELLVRNDDAAGTFTSTAPEARGRFILRGGGRDVLWVINDEDSSYLEIPTASLRPRARPAPGSRLKATGASRLLLGHRCDEYLVGSSDGEERHVWATGALGRLYAGIAGSMRGIGGRAEALAPWQQELVDRRLVPLLVETYRAGTLSARDEITAIDRVSVPPATFDPPDGYARRALPATIDEMYKRMGEGNGIMNDKDFPGMNAEIEKMLEQLRGRGLDTGTADTSAGGGRR